MTFPELMNDLATVKNEAIKITKNMNQNDDNITKLIDTCVDSLDCSLDACRNPNREIQLPITKIFTTSIDNKNDDELLKKVIDRFGEYKETFEESCEKVSNVVLQFRRVFSELVTPMTGIKNETNNCYQNYKQTVDSLAKPLICIIDGFEIDEFRKKNFKDANILAKFKSLLESLKDTFKNYNECLTNFNKESYGIFQKVSDTDNLFSNMLEDKLLKNIRKVPGFLNKGILLLPDMAKQIQECTKKGDARIKFYDECLTKILNASKDVDSNSYEANKAIEENMRNLKEKTETLRDEIVQTEQNYLKYAKQIKEYGQKIIEIVDEIRKLFEFPKMNINIDNLNIQYPFLEYTKQLKAGYEKLEEIKEAQKPLKLIMVVFGKQINMVTLDILFIMDITISMADLLQETRDSIKYIVDKIKKDSPGIDIRFAYEGYRDFADLKEGEKYYTIDFMTDYEGFKEQLDQIEAKGGGDDAEDVAGGLDAGLNMSWRSNARYAILIADAPAHGSKYHGDDVQDDYEKGDPNGRELEALIKEYVNKNINLCVTRIDDYTDKMFAVFDKVYKENTKDPNKNHCKFQIVEYNEEGNMEMGNTVAKTAIEIYNFYSKSVAL